MPDADNDDDDDDDDGEEEDEVMLETDKDDESDDGDSDDEATQDNGDARKLSNTKDCARIETSTSPYIVIIIMLSILFIHLYPVKDVLQLLVLQICFAPHRPSSGQIL